MREPQFYEEQKDIITNPILVVEVLSASTEKQDRGFKLLEYQRIASLQVYLMVWQDKPIVECYLRQDQQHWTYTAYVGMETIMPLECLHCELKLGDIYQWVDFEAEEDKE